MKQLLLTALVAACALSAMSADARVIHRERSLYSTILVDQRGSLICLQFSIRRDQRNQSCIDKRHPQEMVFTYTRMMMAGLLLNPDPERVLILGLGGGTLPMALAELYPDAKIDVVEIDPAVVTVAREFFDFEPTENMQVFTQDARVYTKRAGLRGETYDLIMLDAFNGDYIPEHLMTREYLEETQKLMAENAVVVANTFSISQLYHHESTTYQAVFGTFFNLTSAASANRIILASNMAAPSRSVLEQRAKALAPRLRKYSVQPEEYPRAMITKPDWDTSARVLTDQYSPANLLRGR
ncbi:MAG: fused MFS/spermidine synthase [Gammaproteobacteria bacterium]|nr:fused MFS/spermidine synthase [Gammaproteobacteria bacterium]